MTRASKVTKKKPVEKSTTLEHWVVTTSNDRPLAEIAKELSAAGFSIDETLDQIGVITGRSDDKAVKKARSIRGVTDVSPQPEANVGPPGSRDTW